MGRPAIETDNLRRTFATGRGKRRRSIEAVRGITFDVAAGERLAFIGPNGAGKSTSIKMLSGLLQPTSGTASVLGITPWDDRRRLSGRIGALFGQRSQLWTEIPPLDSFRMLGAIHDIDDAVLVRRVAQLGDLLEATELFDQPTRSLSLGQRMRCELTACMLHEPELLFLDEPTIGLDLLGKQLFRDLVVRLNTEAGTTIFLTSHDVADIEHVADRAVVVNHGVIIHDAPVDEMRSRLLARKQVIVGLSANIDLTAFRNELSDSVVVDRTSDSVVRLEVDTNRTDISAMLSTVISMLPVADLSVLDPPLDAVIGEIYRQPQGTEL